MAKRRLGIVILLLCLCLCTLPCSVLAAATVDAKEPINTDRECALTISYRYEGKGFPNQTVKLYQIAEVSTDFRYTLSASFAASGLALNGMQSNSEWDVVRSTLEAFILANDVEPVLTTLTDNTGNVSFPALKPGLYLASAVEAAQEKLTCCFDSALIALPGLGTDGYWQYPIDVAAKPEVLPPVEPDGETVFKVLKLWKGDAHSANRPRQIEVEVFRDGISYETVILSEDNQWSYSWVGKGDGADWKVIERNVPSGYAMTVSQKEATFLLTNTWISEQPETPRPPKTGDTANIMLYTILLFLSGSVLILLAIAGKRKHYEETNEA